MPKFEYVFKREFKPYKAEILEIINMVQDEVRKHFTLERRFVGSASRDMITREINGNIGFDFDVDLEPNIQIGEYSPFEIRDILYKAIKRCARKFGYSTTENSTSVITIKVVDKYNKKVEHSCDFAIVHRCDDGRYKYIRFNKVLPFYCSWEYRPTHYDIEDKLQWILDNKLKQKLRDQYIDNKNSIYNQHKKSITVFAETVHSIYNQYNRNSTNIGLINPFRMGLL